MASFRLMTYNILNGGVGREQLIREVIGAIQPDVAVFTEVTRAGSFESIAGAVGPHSVGRNGRHAGGFTAIASRWPIIQSDLHGPPWARQKWVEATVRPRGGPAITVHGVHLVAQPLWPFEVWRRQEVRWLLKRLQSSGGAHIVAGDFNALMAGDTPRRESAPAWVRAQWLLQGGATPRWAMTTLINAGYTDCYRASHPRESGFTVPAWDPSARVDYVFASRDLESALRSSGTLAPSAPASPAPQVPRRSVAELLGWKATASLGNHASDHLPVWADFEWPSEDDSHQRPAGIGLQPNVASGIMSAEA